MMRIAVPTNRPENVINYLDALTGLGAREKPEGFLILQTLTDCCCREDVTSTHLGTDRRKPPKEPSTTTWT